MARTLKKEDGDIVLQSSNGRAILISGNEKLAQDGADALMADYDPERGIGSRVNTISALNANHNVTAMFSRGRIRQEVRDALERLQALQASRSDQLTSYEALGEIEAVRVFSLSKTSMMYMVNLVPAGGLDVLPLSFAVNLRHQLPPNSSPGLFNGIRTDDSFPL